MKITEKELQAALMRALKWWRNKKGRISKEVKEKKKYSFKKHKVWFFIEQVELENHL